MQQTGMNAGIHTKAHTHSRTRIHMHSRTHTHTSSLRKKSSTVETDLAVGPHIQLCERETHSAKQRAAASVTHAVTYLCLRRAFTVFFEKEDEPEDVSIAQIPVHIVMCCVDLRQQSTYSNTWYCCICSHSNLKKFRNH